MCSKRKRSDDASPMSVSSFGAVSTPDAQSPTIYPQFDGAMDMDGTSTPRSNAWGFVSAHRVKNHDWGLRTRKRVRDNRPNERAIHENTVHKLFSAQRNHPHASPILSDLNPSNQPTITISKPQKSTLHSFWNLPVPPVQAPIFTYQARQQNQEQGPRCDDCDAQLETDSDGMDVDMDLDGTAESSPFACHECGKNVCGTCAVVSTARHCLQCATAGKSW